MTMYEKHIEALGTFAVRSLTPEQHEALVFARELMRVARPKDPDAERDYCFRVAERLTGYEWTAPGLVEKIERERAAARAEGFAQGVASQQALGRAQEADFVALLKAQLSAAQAELCETHHKLFAERAEHSDVQLKLNAAEAALAEVRARNEKLENLLSLSAVSELETKLAAQAEIQQANLRAKFCANEANALLGREEELETKLHAAQAEIERMAARGMGDDAYISVLETKLTNLRTAAERVRQGGLNPPAGVWVAFCAAIEASK